MPYRTRHQFSLICLLVLPSFLPRLLSGIPSSPRFPSPSYSSTSSSSSFTSLFILCIPPQFPSTPEACPFPPSFPFLPLFPSHLLPQLFLLFSSIYSSSPFAFSLSSSLLAPFSSTLSVPSFPQPASPPSRPTPPSATPPAG